MKNKNQIGCGYCSGEQACPIRTNDVNRAKLKCPLFCHYSVSLPIDRYQQNAINVLNDWEKERISLPPLIKTKIK